MAILKAVSRKGRDQPLGAHLPALGATEVITGGVDRDQLVEDVAAVGAAEFVDRHEV
jgi:hypothetical protein